MLSKDGVALNHSNFQENNHSYNISGEDGISHVLYTFISDNSDQGGTTTDAHMETVINELSDAIFLIILLITIWVNVDGCSEQ